MCVCCDELTLIQADVLHEQYLIIKFLQESSRRRMFTVIIRSNVNSHENEVKSRGIWWKLSVLRKSFGDCKQKGKTLLTKQCVVNSK